MKNCIVVISYHLVNIYNVTNETTANEIAQLMMVLSNTESSPILKNQSDSR